MILVCILAPVVRRFIRAPAGEPSKQQQAALNRFHIWGPNRPDLGFGGGPGDLIVKAIEDNQGGLADLRQWGA